MPQFDALTNTILRSIAALGFTVTFRTTADGHQFDAVHRETGERHTARGDDPYRCACELAKQVGIDLEDG